MYVNVWGKFWNDSYQDAESSYCCVIESGCFFIVIFLLTCNLNMSHNEIVLLFKRKKVGVILNYFLKT